MRSHTDERWEALQTLVNLGKEKKIDVLVISGDLFDKDIDAESLRPQIRELFSNTGFKVLIIPGNHDIGSYKSSMYFGEDVSVLGKLPFESIEYGDELRIVGMPFEPIQGEALLREIRTLKEILRPDKKNILLCHGELLGTFFSRADSGAEGEGRYMPFKLSYFEGLNIDYILAGHFHSKFDVWQLKNQGYFVYPGSPVSITKVEKGQRKINLFEVGGTPREYLLDTFHFQELVVEFDPFRDQDPVQMIQAHVEKLHSKASIILTVRGYINSEQLKMTEKDLVAKIREIMKGRCAEEHYEFRDISKILENDLFKGFTNKARESGYAEEEIKRLQYITIRAMMKARL